MNERVSIICLIYQSPEYADYLYDNIMAYTPEIESGEAEFFFVANDATEEVLTLLKDRGYPHYVNNNPHYTNEELFERGFCFPEYMARVYMGYNFGMRMAKNPILMLVSSDNCFSFGWLQNLRKRLTMENVVSPRLIQPTYTFPNPINHTECEVVNFGVGIDSFRECDFTEWVYQNKKDSESLGNAFMPFMIHKSNVELVGYYPEGNLHNGSFDWMLRTGDTEFYLKLAEKGIKHITSNDSIVYHFDQGERLLKKE